MFSNPQLLTKELSDTKDQLTATELELQDLKNEKEVSAMKAVKVAEEIRNKLNKSETEKSQLKTILHELQTSKEEAENQVPLRVIINLSNSI